MFLVLYKAYSQYLIPTMICLVFNMVLTIVTSTFFLKYEIYCQIFNLFFKAWVQ